MSHTAEELYRDIFEGNSILPEWEFAFQHNLVSREDATHINVHDYTAKNDKSRQNFMFLISNTLLELNNYVTLCDLKEEDKKKLYTPFALLALKIGLFTTDQLKQLPEPLFRSELALRLRIQLIQYRDDLDSKEVINAIAQTSNLNNLLQLIYGNYLNDGQYYLNLPQFMSLTDNKRQLLCEKFPELRRELEENRDSTFRMLIDATDENVQRYRSGEIDLYSFKLNSTPEDAPWAKQLTALRNYALAMTNPTQKFLNEKSEIYKIFRFKYLEKSRKKRAAILTFCDRFYSAENDQQRLEILHDKLRNPDVDILLNRGTGFYQFKHSHRNDIGKEPHWSNSTTEDRLLELEEALRPASPSPRD